MVHSLSACVAGALVLLPSAAVALPSWFSPSFHFGDSSIPVLPRSTKPTTTTPFSYIPPAHAPLPTVAAAWYAGWHGGPLDFPPEDVSWEKYTTVNYAFVETTPDPGNLTVTLDDDPILRRVVTLGHEVGTNIIITVGGWTGSQYFSTAVGSPANRTKFINALTTIVKTYNLDGIDFDWEYPASEGIGCNLNTVNDSANFLELLKELRASPKLASTATLSAATATTPFIGIDGKPLKDVSEFARYLDYIEVMNYDVWGSWSPTAGPNAPLNDTCVADNTTQAGGSAVSAIAAWTGAGFPLDQIVLGVAGYGHSYEVTHSAAFGVENWSEKKNGLKLNSSYPEFDTTTQPFGDLWDDAPGVDVCGNPETAGGLFDFWGLITNEFLDTNGTALPGIAYYYDDCTQTPSVYNTTSNVWVEYDDATSFAAKGAYIKTIGLRGFSLWEAGGDFNDILLDSIRSGAGLPELSFDCVGGEPVSTSRLYPTYPTPTPTPSLTSTSAIVTHSTTKRHVS